MTWANATTTESEWSGFSLMIDTDTYAGNIERATCAACTGVLDDSCFDAVEVVKSYDGPNLEDLVGGRNDEHGNWRPAQCWPTPGTNGKHNTVRIHLNKFPDAKTLDGIKRRALAFAASSGEFREPFRIIGFRLIRERITTQSRDIGGAP